MWKREKRVGWTGRKRSDSEKPCIMLAAAQRKGVKLWGDAFSRLVRGCWLDQRKNIFILSCNDEFLIVIVISAKSKFQ